MFNKMETSLPTITIDKSDLNKKCFYIGSGFEGTVFEYNDKYAIKVFGKKGSRFYYKRMLKSKMAKLEALAKLEDESFCFPIGLVKLIGSVEEGYYMNLVKSFKNFNYLKSLTNKEEVLETIVKADAAIQRVHQKGVIIGDVREPNILLDDNLDPKFIDTDNYMYQDFPFDLYPGTANLLESATGKKGTLIDSDKFAFSLMVMGYIFGDFNLSNYRMILYIREFIERLDISREDKESLRAIFSDATDKPYIGPVLQRIKPNIILEKK